ncbi:bifunctional heptose 7-phosphate kinase/heptose 1-phosphate adenyltransferase [Lewinella cohaerens]|uniref:bifunctional heptose 7-phosphate kinase/heptose 1-phosphate adenyltransferase n=1 Tax=Lewinella cohaerens TaxID=70995 RepID=UPI000370DE92|nr:PfkB family carbohydrate kinase [Lewinella cohaerens]
MNSADFLGQFSQLNIVVIGDVMIDRYLSGKVDRISPEAPVPVVHLRSEDNRLGGAANVALNIEAMGATPYLFSVIGADDNGKLLQQLLPAANISANYLLEHPGRVTTVKTRVLAQNQHLLRVDREDTSPIKEPIVEQLMEQLKNLFNQEDIHLILFQDYNKGVLTPGLIQQVMQEALHRGIPTAVDPKYDNFWAYRDVTLFKPNLREIQQQIDPHLEANLSSLKKAAAEVNKRLGNAYTMITLSEKGVFVAGNELSEIIPTYERTIADVCGAGDTVISIMALGLAAKMELSMIARLANLAGGQVCEKVGVVPVDKHQLAKEYAALGSE